MHTTQPDHPHATQVFVPYQTIFRVEIHPEEDERRRHLGFLSSNSGPQHVPEIDTVPAAKHTARKKQDK